MRIALAVLFLLPAGVLSAVEIRKAKSPANQQISYAKFLKTAKRIEPYRHKRRVTEERFLKLAAEKGTLILDTRSKWAYDKVHVQGAVHLNFSDITKGSLARVIGKDKNRRVLIYCNNNFRTKEPALATKSVGAALNIPTFITLYEYGYKNLYELGPVVEPGKSKLKLVSTPTPVQTRQPVQARRVVQQGQFAPSPTR